MPIHLFAHHVRGFSLAVCALLLGGRLAQAATTWTVGASGKNYTTLAAAIANASTVDGDTISVEDAVQTEQGITVSKSVTIQGKGATNTILQANASRRTATDWIMSISAGKAVTVQDITLQHGYKTSKGGGAIYVGANANLTVQDCIVRWNDSTASAYNESGGAIHAGYDGGVTRSLRIMRCTFEDNVSANNGGAVFYQYANGGVTISDSLFVNNSATNNGGAVMINMQATQTGNVVVANCTFSRNRSTTAPSNYKGGGGLCIADGTVTGIALVCNSSFVSNSAGYAGGGLYFSGKTNHINSVLLAGNTASAYTEFYVGDGCYVTATNCLWEGTYRTGAGFSGDSNNQKSIGVGNAKVDGALAWNSGPTRTHALLAGSPAINTGANVMGLSYDQRGSGYNRVIQGQADIGAFEYLAGPVCLSYSTNVFYENATFNNGTIDNASPVTIDLVNDETFTGSNGDDFAAGGTPKVVIGNLPANLTGVVSRVSATRVSVTITGAAASHGNADDVSNLTFAFQSSAFTGGNSGLVGGSTNSALRIDFLDAALPPDLSYTAGGFTEAAANDGSIDNGIPLKINLANDTFAGSNGDDLYAQGRVQVANLPLGLTSVVTRTGSRELTVTLTGKATAHNASNNAANVTFNFLDSAFTGGSAAGATGNPKSDLTVSYRNPVLTWNGSFTEKLPANDGSIDPATTATATLVGDVFTGADGSSMAGKFTAGNVPSGLSLTVTKTSNTLATVTFSGNAAAHANANDVTNLTVTFGDAAFQNGGGAAVTNGNKTDLAIDFKDPPKTWYVSQTGTNVPPGDGSLVNPWATITYAIGQASPWDTIHVLSGVLTEPGIAVNKPMTIAGDGKATTVVQAATARKGAANRVFYVTADAVISNLTIRHGSSDQGAAVGLSGASKLRLENCNVVSNDYAGFYYDYTGGAVYGGGGGELLLIGCEVTDMNSTGSGGVLSYGARLVVSNSVIARNIGLGGGGGIQKGGVPALLAVYGSTIADNFSGMSGGGISVYQNTLYVCDSTISGNTCTNAGGGIYVYSSSDLTMVNSTVYGNTALTTNGPSVPYVAGGGGVHAYAITTMRNCTIVSNACPAGVAGGLHQYFGNLDMESTILAGNTAATGPDHWRNGGGTFAERFNLVGKTNDSSFVSGWPNANTSYVGTAASPADPMLLPLADNKGLTRTCALQAGSPAIDKGSNPLGLLYDQRGPGYVRTFRTRPDIGAFEFGAGASRGTAVLFR